MALSGTGYGVDGFDTLVCAEHFGGLVYHSGRRETGVVMVCDRDEDCTTRVTVEV